MEKKLPKYIALFFILLMNSCASIPVKIPDYIRTVPFDVSALRDVTTLEQSEITYFIEVGELFIAPYSKVQIDFKGYCLSADLPAPSANDEMVFSYNEPKIPLIGKIKKYILANPNIEQSFMQGLIWNLANKVKFEDLSYEE